MKKLKSALQAMLVCMPFLFHTPEAHAQQCLTSSLTVNTGYTSAGVLPDGSSDPHWTITYISPALSSLVSTPAPPFAAVRTSYSSWTATDPNSGWIFVNDPSSWYNTLNSNDDYSFKVTRDFRLCGDDDIKIDLKMSFDNWVRTVKIDGTTIYTGTATNSYSAVSTFTSIPALVMTLSSGTHTIEADVVNYHPGGSINPHGFQMVGTMSSNTGNSTIVNDHDCPDYECEKDECDETCFWKLRGNNISGTRNIFGTLNEYPVRIKTANQFRGIMDTKGQLGWNTMTPNAYLHVNCKDNNNDKGYGVSDIRFENLEPGHGTILVIDDKGFVYNSHIAVDDKGMVVNANSPAGSTATTAALNDRITELEGQVKQLTARLNLQPQSVDALDQNIPNPAGTETLIGYNIQQIKNQAAIVITDLSGRELKHYAITESGHGQVKVSCAELTPGSYLYTLFVDGRRVDSKKMMINK